MGGTAHDNDDSVCREAKSDHRGKHAGCWNANVNSEHCNASSDYTIATFGDKLIMPYRVEYRGNITHAELRLTPREL